MDQLKLLLHKYTIDSQNVPEILVIHSALVHRPLLARKHLAKNSVSTLLARPQTSRFLPVPASENLVEGRTIHRC